MEAWDNDYEAYLTYMNKKLRQEKKLNGYLMRLNEASYDCDIYQREEADADSVRGRLFEKIPNKNIITEEEAYAQTGEKVNADYIFVIKDKTTGTILDTAVFTEGKRQ